MSDSDDDLTAALRRELAGTAVPYDDDRADAMIRTATATDPIGARSWQAPLAAAAAVLVVGGGAAVIATTRGGSGHPSGSGAGACPVASTIVVVAPSTTATVILPAPGTAVPSSGSSTSASPSPTVEASSGEASDPYAPPEPQGHTAAADSTAPESSAPDSPATTTADPTATTSPTSPTDVQSSSAAPSPVPSEASASPCAPSSAPVTSDTTSPTAAYPLPPSAVATTPASSEAASPTGSATSIVIKAPAGRRAGTAVAVPAGVGVSYDVNLVTLAGNGGTITGVVGSRQYFVHELSTDIASSAGAGHVTIVDRTAETLRFTLNCTGTVDCSVRVSLGRA